MLLTTSEPMIEIVDQTVREDLAQRTEVKFALEDVDIHKVRQVLESSGCRVRHAANISTVRSLYFDDERLSACYANLNGDGRRRKLRIRWYDTPLPQHDFFLEVKWRRNRVTGKHRYGCRSRVPLADLRLKHLSRSLLHVAPSEVIGDCMRSLNPVMVVQYRREHFVSRDRSIRMTLDFDLQFFDQLGRDKLSLNFPKKLNRLIVVEGKTAAGNQRSVRELLHPLALRVGRCSKYVHGCRELGHIHSNL